MSDKPVRTVGMRQQHVEDDDVSLDVEYIPDLPMPLDPVELAAGRMVAAALAADPSPADVGKSPGAVIVLLCSKGWQAEVNDAWRTALGVMRPVAQHWDARDRKRMGPLSVVSVEASRLVIDAEVRLALRDCRGVVVSAPDRDAVSPELLATADAVVHLPPLSAPMLQEVAAAIGNGEALLVAKTTFAKRLASECEVAFVSASFSAWDSVSKEGHLSGLQKAMRQSFAEAKQAAPCIMLIDELDSIPARGRTRYDDYWTPVVNCLLECLDGVGGREGVVVVAASNHPDKIDPGILRSGRLDRRIHISLPDTEALQAILQGCVGDSLPAGELRRVAIHGAGSTGADVERWCRGARRRARAAGRSITAADLLAEAIGPQRRRSPERMRQVAYHEAGHALLVALRQPGLLDSVSIVQSGQAGGGASWHVEPGGDTNEDLDIVIRELLAGRAAEELVLGMPGGGSGGPPDSDLGRATLLAASAELSWGLGDRLTWRADPQPETLPGLLAAHRDVAARVEGTSAHRPAVC